MASVKHHVYRIAQGDNGTVSCDYRGGGELGAGNDDQHRTIPQLEIDPAPAALIAAVVEHGPSANKVYMAIAGAQPDWVEAAASVLGLEGSGPVGLRLGVWDK